METKERNSRISLVKEILSLPEGKQFLAASLIALMALAGGIISMEIRFERNVDKIQDCEKDKQKAIKEITDTFLNFVIKSNERAEITREKLDSINFELLKLKR